MKNTLLAAMLWALSAFGADVSGKWTGTVEIEQDGGEKKIISALLELKQDGTKVTGTAGAEKGTPLQNPRRQD